MSAHYQGEFHARKPGSKPMMKGGHQPGIKVGNDRFPESHVELHPPGTAPAESSFRPNPISEVPSQANNPEVDLSSRSDPLDFPGATSKDVNTGYGRPLQGQEGREVAAQLPGKKHTGTRMHDRAHKKEGTGLGAIAANVNKNDPEGVKKGVRGKGNADYPGAEEREPAKADEVAAERF